MNLAIDIGNSRTKLAVFDGDQLQVRLTWDDWTLDDLVTLTTNQKVKNVILSTVKGQLPAGVEAWLRAHFSFVEMNAETPLPIENRYRTPQTLGRDRLAAVVGAFQLFPGQPSLVIDAGTCITYDVIDGKGIYWGGNISPGVGMRFRSMNAFTDGLPLVEAAETDSWLGDSTVSALRNGAQIGALMEIEGFISYFCAQFSGLNAILTGGDADFFAKKLKSKIFVNQNLVLMGLNKILNYNVERLE